MISLNVNGNETQIKASPDTPLLWVLREELKLVGTKFGCGMAQCGACTVHLDGKAIRSCITPVQTVEGKSITTIEGITPDGQTLHPVQESWIAHQVPQCGYCQSGQIMSAVALLNVNPSPSEDEIDQAMSGNICRCGTYSRIKVAILGASSQIVNSSSSTINNNE
ncbi:MAG: (2Fe-2S)-binding protein [Flammeovirgaceae bacterium]|nr:(2Fe-2S)-binding protein [Flammeovirgaceae bacterium]